MASTSTYLKESRPDHWHFTELEDHQFQIGGRTVFFAVLTFAIVVFVVVLLLCTRWLYRYRRRQNGLSHAPRSSDPHQCRGLDAPTIDAIPITLHQGQTEEERDSECCICLGKFEEGDKVKSLPRCRHCFHSECVDRWLLAHCDCPLCRASVVVDQHVVVVVDSAADEPEMVSSAGTGRLDV
ncbi:RING-H2 finger protein ATL66 [Linum grandiflorum]